MRRLFIPLILLLLACQALTPALPAASIPTPLDPAPSAIPSSTSQPSATPSEAPPTQAPPTSTLAPTPLFPIAVPTLEASATPAAPQGFAVRLHPDGPLFVGDKVSLEVIAPSGVDTQNKSVQVIVDGLQGTHTLTEKFGAYGLGGRSQATFMWAWDTSGLPVGLHPLTFAIQPGGPTWSETVHLYPQSQEPPPEPQAVWATAKTACCELHYITGTAADRDIAKLSQMVDQQAQDVAQKFQTNLSEPIEITFLPRVLGNGGFTTREIAVSYLDRDYTGDGITIIVHHEMVHVLDSRLGGNLRPTLLVEGLAVYFSGGHFKPEPLMPRAAALLPPQPGCQPVAAQGQGQATPLPAQPCSLGWYVPLDKLSDNFYYSQHEIGYLEASSLVEFMVKTWGWPAFSSFYRDIHNQPEVPLGKPPLSGAAPASATPPPGGPQYQAIDIALRAHFGISYQQLEGRFLQALSQERLTPENVIDVRATVNYHNTMRHYQQLLDPSAYFLNAWLPDMVEMRQRNIVADYLRRPLQPENIALEALLVTAGSDLRSGDYASLERVLAAANATLDGFTSHVSQPFNADPLAANYLALVQAVQARGYQAQIIQVSENKARVWATTTGPDLKEIDFSKIQGEWILAQEASLLYDRMRLGIGLHAPPS